MFHYSENPSGTISVYIYGLFVGKITKGLRRNAPVVSWSFRPTQATTLAGASFDTLAEVKRYIEETM